MKTVAISILGTVLDRRGQGNKRWEKWRPTISLCQHDDLLVDRLELILDKTSMHLAEQVKSDIEQVSPETDVQFHFVDFSNPWDFESVYSELLDFTQHYKFKTSKEEYLIHITTGTHVAQICLFLLTESRYIPGKLIQTSPPTKREQASTYQIIDLDLSKYDQLASRLKQEHQEGTIYLKGGITTKNAAFNKMIAQLEQVSIRSTEPILLTGPTGAGKSQLAKRIYNLRQQRCNLNGDLVVVNCATLRGENAMAALFGHKKGAFTGATSDRPGLLMQANKGLLFLDEIGELGLDEQAMLLRAIEDKRFLPFGADKEVSSDFSLIAGTNRDLSQQARCGKFREDLLARIDLWTYKLPSLKERLEDLETNLLYELEKFTKKGGAVVSFTRGARAKYLEFGSSPEAIWSANFRDLNASVTRMCTLASEGRITTTLVNEEISRLKSKWHYASSNTQSPQDVIEPILGKRQAGKMDLYDQAKLALIIQTCQNSSSMADAGRKLFNISRQEKKAPNDSHRVRQLLSKHNITFEDLKRS